MIAAAVSSRRVLRIGGWLQAVASPVRTGGGINPREADHFGGQARIPVKQIGLGRSLHNQRRDQWTGIRVPRNSGSPPMVSGALCTLRGLSAENSKLRHELSGRRRCLMTKPFLTGAAAREIRDRTKALARIANYLPDPNPSGENWTGPPLRYKE
jgi:hypothetical protein